MTLSKAQRIEHLKIMAEKYREAGNEQAAVRCEAQIRNLERHDD